MGLSTLNPSNVVLLRLLPRPLSAWSQHGNQPIVNSTSSRIKFSGLIVKGRLDRSWWVNVTLIVVHIVHLRSRRWYRTLVSLHPARPLTVKFDSIYREILIYWPGDCETNTKTGRLPVNPGNLAGLWHPLYTLKIKQ